MKKQTVQWGQPTNTPPHKDPLFWIILFCVGMMMLIAIARNRAVQEVQAPTNNQQVINDARKLTEELNALVLQDPIEEQPQVTEFPIVYNASGFIDKSQIPNTTGATKQEIDWDNPKGVRITAIFTPNFIEKYEYENATGYRFAIKIDGNYYNVYRNENDGVSNSIKHGLTGAIPSYQFKEGYTWDIPFGEIKVANAKGSYGFHTVNLEKKQSYQIEISTVKEGVETHELYLDWYY